MCQKKSLIGRFKGGGNSWRNQRGLPESIAQGPSAWPPIHVLLPPKLDFSFHPWSHSTFAFPSIRSSNFLYGPLLHSWFLPFSEVAVSFFQSPSPRGPTSLWALGPATILTAGSSLPVVREKQVEIPSRQSKRQGPFPRSWICLCKCCCGQMRGRLRA